MKLTLRSFVLIAILLVIPLSACGPKNEQTEEENKPVTLEPIEGTDLNRLSLTQEASDRLGLETAPVLTQEINGAERLVIPYAALLYDPSGQAWAYVQAGPLVFMREAITVDSIDGERVILSDGLEVGTSVVTLGSTELYGSESEFEEE